MRWFRKRADDGSRARPAGRPYALYYASDLHGSDQCWRKFLGAGRFYGVQALIMGGDLTGKAIVPIEVDAGGSFTATLLGETRNGRTAEEREHLLDAIRFNGMYPWPASREEIARHRDDSRARGALFERVMLDELRRWIALA